MTNELDHATKLAAALDVLRSLEAAGHAAYLAGGCVRDLLLGRTPSDYDVATSATPDEVLALFPRCFAVGAHFGVVLVAGEQGTEATEVATFRNDGAYSDGRHPDAVRYTLSAEEDVRRRDFTINGLLLPLSAIATMGQKETLRAAVVDYVGGVADLDAGVVRAIGDATERFEEDHLRMLRAVRFAARFDFALDAATLRAIQKLAPRMTAVSRERVRDELSKMLAEGRARRAFELLDETGLLAEVLPEVARMKGVAQPPEYHPEGDVWRHVLLLLEQLPAGATKTLGWATLLHDVGKPATFRVADRIRFDGHAAVGAAIAGELCQRLRFSNDETEQIVALVADHMRFMDVQQMKESTLKRFFRRTNFAEHLALHRMDCLASSGHLENWRYAEERWRSMPEEAVQPRLLLSGRALIAAGYRPGPQFKAMLVAAEDAQLEGTIHSADEALALIAARFGAPPQSASCPDAKQPCPPRTQPAK